MEENIYHSCSDLCAGIYPLQSESHICEIVASNLKRHVQRFHGANLVKYVQSKHGFCLCFEYGQKYHKIRDLQSHLISSHNNKLHFETKTFNSFQGK